MLLWTCATWVTISGSHNYPLIQIQFYISYFCRSENEAHNDKIPKPESPNQVSSGAVIQTQEDFSIIYNFGGYLLWPLKCT